MRYAFPCGGVLLDVKDECLESSIRAPVQHLGGPSLHGFKETEQVSWMVQLFFSNPKPDSKRFQHPVLLKWD
jgi:hypothetical protein